MTSLALDNNIFYTRGFMVLKLDPIEKLFTAL